MRNNRIFVLCFRIFAIILTIAGLLTTMISNNEFHASSLMYYTVQSNILVLGLFILLTYHSVVSIKKTGTKGESSGYETLSFVVLIDILLTFFVYWVLLAPTTFTMSSDSYNIFSFSNLTVHGFVPILVALDYFFFTMPKNVKFVNVVYCWIFPLYYVIFAFIAGYTGYVYSTSGGVEIHYPYDFLNIDKWGGMVALWIFLLLLFFTALATLFYFIDKKRLKNYLKPWKKDI